MKKETNLGRILWWSVRDQNGIIVDVHGNEFYFDISVLLKTTFTPKSDIVLRFSQNENITDCLCAHNITAATSEEAEKYFLEEKKQLSRRLGVVLWFDDSSGEGMIFDLATGRHLYCHYSAITCDDPHKKVEKNDFVEFKIYRNLYSSQVEKCRILEPDFDYHLVNTCLEMAFDRGVDVLAFAPKYEQEQKKQCMVTGRIISTTLWKTLGVPLDWKNAIILKRIDDETKGDVRENREKYIKHLRCLRKLEESKLRTK